MSLLIPRPLTQDRLKELLRYDPETGEFTRAKAVRGFRVGAAVGHLLQDTGYITIRIDGQPYLAHRLAWLYMTGAWPDALVDHENQNRADNRWVNLRAATSSQNLINSKMWSNNTSGVKGVWWFDARGKWVARIHVRGKKINLGYHTTLESAAAARRAAELEYFGEFAANG